MPCVALATMILDRPNLASARHSLFDAPFFLFSLLISCLYVRLYRYTRRYHTTRCSAACNLLMAMHTCVQFFSRTRPCTYLHSHRRRRRVGGGGGDANLAPNENARVGTQVYGTHLPMAHQDDKELRIMLVSISIRVWHATTRRSFAVHYLDMYLPMAHHDDAELLIPSS